MLLHEEVQRNIAITSAVAKISTRALDLESRVKALEAKAATQLESRIRDPSASNPSGASSVQASTSQSDSALDDRLRAMEARTAALADAHPGRLEARLAALEVWLNTVPEKELTPLALEAPEELAPLALEATSARIMAGVRSLEDDILLLQGELVMLQARTQIQGVSGSIFSLRAADMDKRSRLKSIEVLVKKEAEVMRILDAATQASERGGMADLLSRLGMRDEQSRLKLNVPPSGAAWLTSSGGELHMMASSRPDATVATV